MPNTPTLDLLDPKAKSPEKKIIFSLEQQSKISYLKKRIIFNTLILFLLGIIMFVIMSYYLDLKKTNDIQITRITNYITNLQHKSTDLKLKANEVKRYREIWKSSKEGKRNLDGININKINELFASLATKYNISNTDIKVLFPEVLKSSAYNRTSLDVLLSPTSISFNALTDVSAISFIQDFINNLPGYVIINSFTIKKNSDGYKDSDLVDISLGKGVGIINVRMDFSWYVLKRKNPEAKNAI